MESLEIVMNLRKKDDGGSYSRHYRVVGANATLCGLSTKQGHAWDVSQAQFVTCAICLRVAKRRAMVSD